MNKEPVFQTISFAISVVGGLLLVIAPFLQRVRAAASRHHRLAILFAGIAAIGWGTLGFIYQFLHSQLSWGTSYLLLHYKSMCSGAALALLVLEFASGEFLAAYRRDKELRRTISRA